HGDLLGPCDLDRTCSDGAASGDSCFDADWFDAKNLGYPPANIYSNKYTFGDIGIGTDNPIGQLDIKWNGQNDMFVVRNIITPDNGGEQCDDGNNKSPTIMRCWSNGAQKEVWFGESTRFDIPENYCPATLSEINLFNAELANDLVGNNNGLYSVGYTTLGSHAKLPNSGTIGFGTPDQGLGTRPPDNGGAVDGLVQLYANNINGVAGENALYIKAKTTSQLGETNHVFGKNVGINTVTPTEYLDVNGNARIRLLQPNPENIGMVTHESDGTLRSLSFPNDPNQVLLGNGTWGNVISSNSDADWFDANNIGYPPSDINSNKYTFGDIGIGTEEPEAQVNVKRNGSQNNLLLIQNSIPTTPSTIEQSYILRCWSNNASKELWIGNYTRFGIPLSGRALLAEVNLFNTALVNSALAGNNNGIHNISYAIIGAPIPPPSSGATGILGLAIEGPPQIRPADNGEAIGNLVQLYGNNINGQSGANALYIKVGHPLHPVTGQQWEVTHVFGENVGISNVNPLYTLDVNGQVNASGGFSSFSDISFKKEISEISTPLEKILQLNGVEYNFKCEEYPEKNFSDKRKIGLIAQDVEKIIPGVVSTSMDGTKSIFYSEIIPILIEAIKELQLQIAELQDIVQHDDLDYKNVPVNEIGAKLYQNSPNPFWETTTISYILPESYHSANLLIYNMNGVQIKKIQLDGNGKN
ncbi:MAG: tail fiber domain-containing protein, partial [Mariniphaga sp.]|nr:tail fiber domain-containing protein [Mariniphaga sp.]